MRDGFLVRTSPSLCKRRVFGIIPSILVYVRVLASPCPSGEYLLKSVPVFESPVVGNCHDKLPYVQPWVREFELVTSQVKT
jgi:hypothetical protein